jgi:hypothetical protein
MMLRMNRRARRLVRNFLGVSVIGDVVLPALGAVAGYASARVLGTVLAESTLPLVGGKMKEARSLASLGSALGTVWLARKSDFIAKNQGALIIGMGIAGADPWLTPLLSSSSAPTATTAAPAEAQPAAAGAYYSERSLGALIDISHAGAPYRGMLGMGDPADQSVIEDHLDQAESISTVEPIDSARRAISVKRFPRVSERMSGTPGDRGYAGGLYARHIFSGMSGG